MIRIYGSMLCPDCVKCREDLDKNGLSYAYLDFAESLLHLKEFLKIRESSPLFAEVKAEGGIGIPCIVKEDGSITLDWTELM